MISTRQPLDLREIFQAIRSSVQELHVDKVILEDIHGAPFLFKSQDARIWVRIFYRAMQEFSIDVLKDELKKLWVLMPTDAVLYLFYPELDRDQILRMNGISDRLNFFEYRSLYAPDANSGGIRICKWVPSMLLSSLPNEKPTMKIAPPGQVTDFLQKARLNSEEIEGLVELSLVLRRT